MSDDVCRLYKPEMRLFSGAGLVTLRSARLDAMGTPSTEMRIKSRLTYYSRPTIDLGGFRIEFAAGAFTKGLKEFVDRWIFADHDPDRVLGREGKNSRLWEDSKGLLFEVSLPQTSLGKDTYELVRSGIKTEASVGFRYVPDRDKWVEKKIDGEMAIVNVVLEAIAVEGSIVREGAMPGTSVSALSAPSKSPSRFNFTNRAEVDAYLNRLKGESDKAIVRRLETYARATA